MKIEASFLQSLHPQDATHGKDRNTSHSSIATPLLSLLLALRILVAGASCFAQAPVATQVPEQAPAAQTTLAIFHDRQMPDHLWQALSASLREELASGSPEIRELETRLASESQGQSNGTDAKFSFQILRGDKIAPGLAVDNHITVYLLGECNTAPAPQAGLLGQPRPWASSTLGWVNMTDGHIEPFIHVDCQRIGQMLGPAGIGRSPEQRNRLMANAIARVVIHEWIHVATQNPHHSNHGVSRAQFSVADLMSRSPQSVMPRGTEWLTPNPESGVRFVPSPAPNQPYHPWGTK